MHLKEDIKDEEKGEKRYKKLAHSGAKHKALYKKMAKDEEKTKNTKISIKIIFFSLSSMFSVLR